MEKSRSMAILMLWTHKKNKDMTFNEVYEKIEEKRKI